jgi:ferredoxin-thioredoxin reductase catalytic subunit
MNKETEDLIGKYEMYAQENGFKLNPDRETVQRIAGFLLKREEQLGEKYCPCRKVTGDKENDKKIICPCYWHKEEIEKNGYCHCRLFSK